MLRTNADLSPLETMLCYKHLWMVERAFRTSKSLFATRLVNYDAKCNALHRLASRANSSAKKRSRFKSQLPPDFEGKQSAWQEGISSRFNEVGRCTSRQNSGPIFHKLDETIRGHVSCSFLALVLKKELEDRIATLGHASSWPNVLADLNSLTETEVEQDGKRFLLRTPPRPAASLALRAAGVALPPTVRQLADA